MYQIQVKEHLVRHAFPPSQGWRVWVDLDAMELGKGKQQSEEKRVAAAASLASLKGLGVEIGAHPKYGRADVVAVRGTETVICEVEGQSQKQSEQAMYSALGQLLLQMAVHGPRFVLAVPSTDKWRRHLSKIPDRVSGLLHLRSALVSTSGIEYLATE